MQWSHTHWLKRLLGARRGSTQEPELCASAVVARRPPTRLAPKELISVCQDLHWVLNQHANSRHVMRYLWALEQVLQKKGRRAIEQLSPQALSGIAEQLEALGPQSERLGLVVLNNKIALGLTEHKRLAAERERLRLQAEEEEIVVEEATHSTFLQVSDQWERSLTGKTPTDTSPDFEPTRPESAFMAEKTS
jgi:hypothetical protein